MFRMVEDIHPPLPKDAEVTQECKNFILKCWGKLPGKLVVLLLILSNTTDCQKITSDYYSVVSYV